MSISVNPPNRRVRRSAAPPPPPAVEAAAGAVDVPPARGSSAASNPPPRRRRAGVGRWLRRLQLVTGLLVVIGASVLVAGGLRRYLRTSPRFAVRTLVVEGNQRRTAHQIAKTAGIAAGMNLFTLDEGRAEQALAADPWIESAKVRKELPNRVHISVAEREARLCAAIEGRLYLVDGKGIIFKEREEADPSDLPVVSGITAAAVARDREGVTARLRRVIDALADLERERIALRYPIQEIAIGEDLSLDVVVGSEAIVLGLGQPPYRLKVQKAARLLGELRYRKALPDVLFLDNQAHPERVVVRMRGEPTARRPEGAE